MHIINYYALMYALAVTAIYTPCGTPLLEYIQKKSVAQWNKVLSILNALLYSTFFKQNVPQVCITTYMYIFYML